MAVKDDFIDNLLSKITRLEAKIRQILTELDKTRKELADANELIRELRAQIGKTSRNSSHPPSSDGLRKKPTPMKPRVRGARKPGGQTGHKGCTLKPREHPDVVIEHKPETCANCGGSLDADRMKKTGSRQVLDLPENIRLEATDHHTFSCQCGHCGLTTSAEFPSGIKAPVQYGSNIVSLVLYWNICQFIPINRIKKSLNEIFTMNISTGTIQSMIDRKAAEMKPVWEEILEQIKNALVANLDETGMRVKGKLEWFHVACTELFCHLRLGEGRGDVKIDATGTLVHDDWAPYRNIETVDNHGLCSAHFIRDLQAEVEGGEKVWALEMKELLLSAIKERNNAKKNGTWFSDLRIDQIENSYERLNQKAIRHYEDLPSLPKKGRGRGRRRSGHNLSDRMHKRMA